MNNLKMISFKADIHLFLIKWQVSRGTQINTDLFNIKWKQKSNFIKNGKSPLNTNSQ